MHSRSSGSLSFGKEGEYSNFILAPDSLMNSSDLSRISDANILVQRIKVLLLAQWTRAGAVFWFLKNLGYRPTSGKSSKGYIAAPFQRHGIFLH